MLVNTVDRISFSEFHAGLAEELVIMWRRSFEEAVGITDPHPLEEQRAYLMNEVVPRNALRVAFLDGEVVGFAAASSVSLAQLYVHLRFQRIGIGKRLLEWAKGQSAGSLWLFTFARNARACAFYERNGFQAVARGFEAKWQLEDVRYEWSAAGQNAPDACNEHSATYHAASMNSQETRP